MALGASLIATTGCGAALGNSTATTSTDLPNLSCDTLTESFQKQQPVTVMGERLEGLSPYARYTSVINWIDVSERHEVDMLDKEKARIFDGWVARFPDNLPPAKLAERIIDEMKKELFYDTDSNIYGKNDYPATPVQTLKAGRGDCEDLADLLFRTMRAKNVTSKNMFLVRVNVPGDDDITHRAFVLDNKIYNIPLRRKSPAESPSRAGRGGKHGGKQVVYFAMNEDGVWMSKRNFETAFGQSRRDEVACTTPQDPVNSSRLTMLGRGR